MNFTIRPAARTDCKDISRMIRELAVYENMQDQVKISHEELERDGFCDSPFYQSLVAEVPEDRGRAVVGYAIFYYTYRTWTGPTVYLEDLYVRPEFRGKGIGKAMMNTVAKVAKQRQCSCLHLSVLDWNQPSIDFYIAKGGRNLTATEGWQFIRFEGDAFENLVQGAPKN
ncbi:diamine acetyltransferase 2b [Denticeps clupeoides]|uniref:N-acetyltransferase domain-containing protein n=1 Tax=Denticeps clupeoides TaxID=299321 RepID=A0AAY4B5T3_9TELE|nr:diamine acetyltransferase 2-like [Denticeps clupeoides]